MIIIINSRALARVTLSSTRDPADCGEVKKSPKDVFFSSHPRRVSLLQTRSSTRTREATVSPFRERERILRRVSDSRALVGNFTTRLIA